MVLALAFMNLSYERKNHEISPFEADALYLNVLLKDYDLLLY